VRIGVGISLDKDDWEAFKRKSHQQNLSANAALRKLIKEYILKESTTPKTFFEELESEKTYG